MVDQETKNEIAALENEKDWPPMSIEQLELLKDKLSEAGRGDLTSDAEAAIANRVKFRDEYTKVESNPTGYSLSDLEWWKEAAAKCLPSDSGLASAIQSGIDHHNKK